MNFEQKVRPPDSFNPADVAPLPSAPPPSYDDAMATSSSFANQGYNLQGQPPYPLTPGHPEQYYIGPNQPPTFPVAPAQPPVYSVPPTQSQPYPIQQVHVVPTGSAPPNRFLPVGKHPLKTTCTSCNKSISTRITTKNNCHPTFWCCLLFITGICIPCSCCPYFFCDKPYRVDHFCPKCNAFLGTYVDAS